MTDIVELTLKWQGTEFPVPAGPATTVADVKRAADARTTVPAGRVKLLGLRLATGKPAADEDLVVDCVLKPGAKIMVLGTPAAAVAALDAAAAAAPPVADDWDLPDGDDAEVAVPDREENQEKLARRIASFDLKPRFPPRPGKKCLVIDIDYTIFDLGSTAETPAELARPHLHSFLAAVYPHYDVIIWSATSMKWVEVKMRELGCADHPDFRLTAYMDHRAMVTVRTERHGVFDCKPLPLLWAKFPGVYGPHNTIMLDDLRRNYVFNPAQGLVIRPYKRAATARATDRELEKLQVYLLAIAGLPTFDGLKHKKWEAYVRPQLERMFKGKTGGDGEEEGGGGGEVGGGGGEEGDGKDGGGAAS